MRQDLSGHSSGSAAAATPAHSAAHRRQQLRRWQDAERMQRFDDGNLLTVRASRLLAPTSCPRRLMRSRQQQSWGWVAQDGRR